MSIIRHLWIAFNDWAEIVGTLEGSETPNLKTLDNAFTQPTFSPAPKDTDTEETNISNRSGSQPRDGNTRLGDNEMLPKESSDVPIDSVSPDVSTYHIDQDRSSLTQRLQLDNVRHLRWQDKASMAIKESKEEANAWKLAERAIKAVAGRAKTAMQSQIGNLQRRIRALELEKTWMTNEHARAVEILESQLREVRGDFQAQKQTAEQAAAAADGRFAEAQTRHEEELATKEEEMKRLRTRVIDLDTENYRLRRVDRGAERLRVENKSLESKKEEAESRTSEAEGRAKGLQDKLVVISQRAEYWESLYKETEEDARDKVLSAYEVAAAQVQEESQQTEEAASGEEGSPVIVENLGKEKSELQGENDRLRSKIDELFQAWEEAASSQKTWEENIHRQCEKEKRDALDEARSNDRGTSEGDVREQDIRRQCEVEKEKALAEERKSCHAQWESRECSLRGQFAVKLKFHTNREMQKLRRRANTERRQQSKVRRSQVKNVLRRAVSRGVEVEGALMQKELQNQLQTQLSNYRTQLQSEHARSQVQSEASKDAGSVDKVLLDSEIKKRDSYISQHKLRLKQAYDEKRKAEGALKTVKEENDRLSGQVTAYEIQESFATQTRTEAQVALAAQDLARALKVLAETATMGLDDKHRVLLNELVAANRLVRDIRSTIEEGEPLDYEDVDRKIQQILEDSDPFDSLDPNERPELHKQLKETYSVVGGLIDVLKGERGDTTNREILEKIYGAKGKGKGKQGSMLVPGVASGPSAGGNGGLSAAPLPQNPIPQASGNEPAFTSGPNENRQPGLSNTTSMPTSTQVPNAQPLATAPQANAAQSQDGPEYMDSATAHALQGIDATNQGGLEDIDIGSIDWTDPIWRNDDPDVDFDFS